MNEQEQSVIERTMQLFREHMVPCDCADSAILQDGLLLHGLTKEKQQLIIQSLNKEYELDIEFSYDWFTLNDVLNSVKQYVSWKEDDQLYDSAIDQIRSELENEGLSQYMAPLEVAQARSEVCFSCHHYNPEKDMCRLCGCERLHRKMQLAPANCPDDPPRWKAMVKNTE